jgi:phenylacetate-CoA ligase
VLEDHLHRLLSWYMVSPEQVRRVVGHTYRRILPWLRYGRAYQEHLDRLSQATTCTWQEVDAALDQTLRALQHVPAFDGWRDVLRVRQPAWERLAQLPVSSKTDIKRNINGYLNRQLPSKRRLVTHTCGSTEHPLQFFLARGQTRPRETAYIEYTALGREPNDWVLSLRGRTVSSAGAQGARMWSVEPIKQHLMFSSDHLERAFMPRYVESLQAPRPTIIHAYPSALFPLTRGLQEQPFAAFTKSVKGILLTSESIYDFQHEAFGRCFPNATIVSHYGHSERVLMATALGDGPSDAALGHVAAFAAQGAAQDRGRDLDQDSARVPRDDRRRGAHRAHGSWQSPHADPASGPCGVFWCRLANRQYGPGHRRCLTPP